MIASRSRNSRLAFTDGGISAFLVEVSFLSRALDDMIHGARSDKVLRALLTKGVRCDWIHPTPAKAVSIALEGPSWGGLSALLPALKDASLDELIARLEAKLKAEDDFLTNRNITYQSGNLPATFEVQVAAHCEGALISYLADRHIESTLYIATALPVCYTCHLLIDVMKGVQGCNHFRLGSYNGVIDCGWEFPNGIRQADNVQKTMIQKINDQLKEGIERYHKPKEPFVSPHSPRPSRRTEVLTPYWLSIG